MIFGRYLATQAEIPQPYTLTSDGLLAANASGFDNLAQSVTLGDTLLLGPTAVNSLRFAVNRTAVARIGASTCSAPSLGINVFSYLPNYMPLSITGGFSTSRSVRRLVGAYPARIHHEHGAAATYDRLGAGAI